MAPSAGPGGRQVRSDRKSGPVSSPPDAIPLPTVCAAGSDGAQHRAGGAGRSIAMASSICWNSVRGTITSAIWNVVERPCRTIFAPILTSRSRNVVMDQ